MVLVTTGLGEGFKQNWTNASWSAIIVMPRFTLAYAKFDDSH
jgi:hypothetical protein